MKILITGATGFIGGRLAGSLLRNGHQLCCTIRSDSDTTALDDMKVDLVEADLAEPDQVEKAFNKAQPDAVFHCAAEVMSKDAEKLYAANVEATFNVCQSCIEQGVKRLVYLSSVSVVSGNDAVPLTDSLAYKASNEYGWSKIEAEMIALDFRKKGLPVAIVRPCMVYGEGEPHLLPRLFDLISKGRFPLLDIPGMDSMLNLADVNNVVQALQLALEKDAALEGSFIVADREVITIRKFVDILYDELGKRPPVVPGWVIRPFMSIPPIRKAARRFFKHRVYDISRAEKLLGYDPEVATEDGLRRVARHWKGTNCPK